MAQLSFGGNFQPARASLLREWMTTAERLGFDAPGISDRQSLYRETWTSLGLLSDPLSRVPIGPWITNPLTRHPAVVASALATLDDA